MLLMLDERDQGLVHRLLMATPEPGDDLLPPGVVAALARLVSCDRVELVELDREGAPGREVDGLARHRQGVTLADGVLLLSIARPAGTVVTVSFRRQGAAFSERDVAVLRMVQPVIAGLIRGWSPGSLGCTGLSSSERRVLALVASGASNAQVAEQLSISVSTVRKHLEHCYRKLGVSNRTAAVAALRQARPAAVPGQRQGSRIG
jgi:DNA-binding CsgD family transcriptional regulator